MPYISLIISIFLTSLILQSIIPKVVQKALDREVVERRSAKENHLIAFDKRTLLMQQILSVLMILLTITLTLFPSILDLLGLDYETVIIVFLLVSVFSVMVLAIISTRIIYSDNNFTILNPLIRKRVYLFDEVVSIRGKKNKIIKYKKGKMILLSGFYGADVFLDILKKHLELDNNVVGND